MKIDTALYNNEKQHQLEGYFNVDLGCAFRFVFQFLTGLIFWNPRNSANSAEHTPELNQSRARFSRSGMGRNP